ncbi:hypothetical protein BAUCODRAFT_24924 [Baudoinia panamericana UAMH 10762]|uniref:Uncharacterized protein n=1 Tax=Baudoinia panamericana (strain UAMH 10762) TaxID=717646 RepID=M2LNL7_BAUPA|nr:uncharacterized protein BAUCODRAFT_24924 [Baudoinia panamericana UAMH 10762]EMC95947.1 hypothetical protein BAUCODRAFT_24924 [Baudoinia panamericana UAMH 10762]
MPPNLTINPAPFKSSNLAIPPSPFSPRLPLSPLHAAPQRRKSAARVKAILELSPPPAEPLQWLWQCHICNRVYKLGVTRRCLDDGHYVCAGTTTVKRSKRTNKKVVRHKACASEFDYQGWEAWGAWRRSAMERMDAAKVLYQGDDGYDDFGLPLLVPTVPGEGQWLSGIWTKKPAWEVVQQKPERVGYWEKDCWKTCDYPSECRWGKQYGVTTPAIAAVPSSPPPVPSRPAEDNAEKLPATTFDETFLDAPSAVKICAVVHAQTPRQPDAQNERKPSMDDLLDSVKRRKRKSTGAVPSPLGSNPPSPTTSVFSKPVAASTASSGTSSLHKAFDDFELDFKKSLERAGELVTGWASSVRSTAAPEDVGADSMVVKALKMTKKKSVAERLPALEDRV